MRQGAGSRRSRGRNTGRGKQQLPLRLQTFDSNGPDVRIRGNAYQVYEKYQALARDAYASGDRVAAENFNQHAEHYFRIVNSEPPQQQQQQNGQGQANGGGRRGQHPQNGQNGGGADGPEPVGEAADPVEARDQDDAGQAEVERRDPAREEQPAGD